MKNKTYQYALIYREAFYTALRMGANKSYAIEISDEAMKKYYKLLLEVRKLNVEYQKMKLEKDFFEETMTKHQQAYNEMLNVLKEDREKEREFYTKVIQEKYTYLENRIKEIDGMLTKMKNLYNKMATKVNELLGDRE